MTVRTRIAPSPTGRSHIGNLRTALYDYLLARQNGGQFIIRIEDTDQERLVPGSLENLLAVFHRLGLDYDEGPVLNPDGTISEKGAYGPYIQTQRLAIYKKHIDELVAKGNAYICFCSAERLEAMREAQSAAKQTPKYDRTCLHLSPGEVKERLEKGERHVVRMKIPEGETRFTDIIRGSISFNNADVDDQVILKSDGIPTYHLAVVVDDKYMNITHVLRGEDWIPSTPKQLILYKMFGWEPPLFAHVPLVLGGDKKKLSKRTGDTAVEDYLEKGYLPAALINFLATLGFNPKADQEIYSLEELVKLFDLSKVNKGGAVFNVERLDWMNHHYLMQLSADELFEAAKPFIPERMKLRDELVKKALTIEQSRVNRLTEFVERLESYFSLVQYDPNILIWKKADKNDAIMHLSALRLIINALSEEALSSSALIEEVVKRYITEGAFQNGNVLWPLRVALSGLERSASPFEFIWALGRGEAVKRVDIALERLNG